MTFIGTITKRFKSIDLLINLSVKLSVMAMHFTLTYLITRTVRVTAAIIVTFPRCYITHAIAFEDITRWNTNTTFCTFTRLRIRPVQWYSRFDWESEKDWRVHLLPFPIICWSFGIRIIEGRWIWCWICGQAASDLKRKAQQRANRWDPAHFNNQQLMPPKLYC